MTNRVKKNSLFVQSEVRQHSELCWLLQCHTSIGVLRRMTQYKQKAANEEAESSLGLLVYPVLMAADILLYNATHVPVGEDQKQHLELCRVLARQMNQKIFYNKNGKFAFTIPKDMVNERTKRIMSLTDPAKKMSKSAIQEHSRIVLSDSSDVVRSKIKKAVTDSRGVVDENYPNRPGIYNLLTIYSNCQGITEEEAFQVCKGASGSKLKEVTAEAVIKVVEPIRQNLVNLQKDKEYVFNIYQQGRESAEAIAEITLQNIKTNIGLGL